MNADSVPSHRDPLREQQFKGIQSLLEEILPQNEFYSKKFEDCGFEKGDLQSLEDLRDLPFTVKEELQADQQAHPPFGTNLSFPVESYTRLHQTSGTSGEPIAWLDTPKSWEWILHCWSKLFEAANVVSEDRFFIPFGYGPFLGFWGAFEGAIRDRHLTIAGGGMSTIARLKWLTERDITVAACTPTYALRLIEVAQEHSIDLAQSKVRLLFVAGEPGGSIPGVRQRLEEGWGARVLDHWGMTEVGPLGFEPIDHPGGVHLFEDECIAEVIDPKTKKPLEGEGRGELVLTTFRRSASPLIRYRTGDLVDVSYPELDPSEVATLQNGGIFARLEGGILGRADQMVLIRGNNVYPGAVEAVMREIDGISEYRATVLGGESERRLSLEIELLPGVETEVVLARVRGSIKNRLYFTPEVQVAPSGSLPRYEFKSRRFEIQEAP